MFPRFTAGAATDERRPTWELEWHRSIAAWTITLAVLFGALKVGLIVWFFSHGVDPFIDLALWKTPLLVASDLLVAGALGILLGLINWFRLARPRTGFMLAPLAAVNVKVVEIYRDALDRDLMHKVGDPRVMSASILANVDASFLLALAVGGTIVGFAPRWLHKRLQHSTLRRARIVGAALILGGLLSMAAAYPALRGRDTLGLKHNAILALALPAPASFQYGSPEEAYARLSTRFPDGASMRSLGESVMHARPVSGHPELRASANGFNVVLLLLESVSAQYVDADTTPTLHELMQHSITFSHHNTTAVNTFAAHYSLFRSMPVRSDAFAMRKLHGGFARDTSIMEVFHAAGYGVGMFHGSFLHFIDTRWVWEAPGVDAIVDAQDIVSAARPGWSWGANDADVADDAIAWARRQGDRRFLLIFNPSASHHPYFAPPPARFPGKDCLPHYKSALYGVDRAIARLLDGLEKSGLAARTVVVGVSDHGELINTRTNTCGHGISLVKDELNVPFFIHHPALTKTGYVDSLPTDHWDVAPTVTSLAGLDVPPQWLGRDLLSETVQPRPTFVGLDYVRHTAVLAGDVVGDLDVGNDRVTWNRLGEGAGLEGLEPDPRAKVEYETLLKGFDDRVILHHAALVGAQRSISPVARGADRTDR
jgi:phosphoglycerol transferase MdoB-like AlkP superfamily enzyme